MYVGIIGKVIMNMIIYFNDNFYVKNVNRFFFWFLKLV